MLLSTCRSRRLFALPLAGLALAAVLVLMAGGAQANTIYTYTGVNFDFASSPYTTAMSVSGSITLASPLAPNLVGHDLLASLASWSFSNGVQTYSSAVPPDDRQVIVSTDANGAIVDWSVWFGDPWVQSCGTRMDTSTLGLCTDHGTSVLYDTACTPSTGNCYGASSTNRGSWAVIPEPSTGLLVALGLTCLAAKGRRRNRS